MILLSDQAAGIIRGGNFAYHVRVESTLDGETLAEQVPVISAVESCDRGSRVPELVTFTVPRLADGMDWTPTTDDHPLAWKGQRLRVDLGVGIGSDGIEWFNRGEFVIVDSEPTGDVVTVHAAGLLYLIDEARLVSPYQPSGTLASTLRGLVEPALTVVVDVALVDRAVPAGINYTEDRLGAVYELLDAWAAEARVTEDGYLLVEPADPGTIPDVSLNNSATGTLITASGGGSRVDAFSVVVATGEADDGNVPLGVAEAPSNSPFALGGAFNPLPVPFFFASPLLRDNAQAAAAARTVLARKLRESAALTFRAEVVPNPAIQAGDLVAITTDHHTDLLCSVEGLALPYVVGDDTPMTLDLRSL